MTSHEHIPILLDWDGVLVDSLGIYLELYRELCRRYEKTLPINDPVAFRQWYQPRWEENFYELGFTQEQYREICEVYPSLLDYGRAPLFPGVAELLETLSARHPLLVVSTAHTDSIEKRLRAAGLTRYFAEVTGSDDGGTEKSERIRELMKRYGGGVGIMVGDTDLDIEAGRDNGLQTVGVTYGWLSELRLASARPHYLVRRPEQLQPTLETCLKHLTSAGVKKC